jgi:septal ring factor EnvC (AmiA/AmiB activator)
MILRRSSRTDPRLVLGTALAFALPFGANPAALAQTPPAKAPVQAPVAPGPVPYLAPQPAPPGSPPTDADALKQRDQELEAARARERESAENQAKLKHEIEALGDDRRALNQQLIDTAAHVRGVEASIEATEGRLKPLDEQERLFQKSLDERRAVITEILAALQRVGHQPPPALMVRPEDALQAVRMAILLGGVLPEMRAQAEALAGDLADLLRVRNDIVAERDHLARDLAQLGHDQLRMNMLIDERQSKQSNAEQALDSERQRATDLARQVDGLKDLIGKLEANLDSANRAAHLAARAAEESRPDVAALSDPGRLAPAVAFAATRGRLPLPVNGVRIREFGTADGFGGNQKGVSIATRTGAQITAPCDGWVVYAGAFRSYGQLLILNAGGGYHVLLAGMERISVDLGQFVLTGEPVAVMGSGSQVSAAAVAKPKQPVLYVEFRKDGTPIDPGPWWATNEGEKVRG